jgi:hypothetical protein
VISVTDNAVLTKDRTAETNQNNLAIESALARFEWDFGQIYSPLFFSTQMNMQSMVSNPAAMVDNDHDGRDDNSGQMMNANTAQPGAQQMNPQLQAYYEQVVERMQMNEHFSGLSKEGLLIPKFFAPEKNIFEFFTTSNRRKMENTKQSSFAWVRYGLSDMTQDQVKYSEENAKEGVQIPKGLKNLTRWFDPNDPWGTKKIDIERVKGAVLLENVEALEFSYWDVQKRKWETSIRSVQNGINILRAVKVFITWYDSQGVKRSAERIFRNHWPLVAPNDQAAGANGIPGQTAGAATAGSTTAGQATGGQTTGGFGNTGGTF